MRQEPGLSANLRENWFSVFAERWWTICFAVNWAPYANRVRAQSVSQGIRAHRPRMAELSQRNSYLRVNGESGS